MDMIREEDCVKIGKVGKTHHLQGAVVIYSDSDLLEQYQGEPVFLLLEGAPVPFFIAEGGLVVRNQSSYIVKFDYVDSKERAERLVGCNVLLPKELVGEEDPEHLPFELEELVGYAVEDLSTGERGEVTDVANYSGNVVLSLQIFEKEILLPLSEYHVKEILPEECLLQVDIPEDIKALY